MTTDSGLPKLDIGKLLKSYGLQVVYVRTMWIFNCYGLCRIGYGYIDYFLIRIKDLVGFLGTQGLDINLYRFLGTQGPIINRITP